MRKIGVILISFIFLLYFAAFVSAIDDNETYSPKQNQTKIDDGYKCLEDKVSGKCSTLNIEEISLTILSNPSSDISSECKSSLLGKKDAANCWPSGSCTIKDTALAILALNNVGEKTDDAEKWLLERNMTPTDVIWYLQQDSNDASQCKITYSEGDYTINVGDNKKIDSSAGPCLSLAQSDFWLQVSPDCYDTEFSITCDKNFISVLLYRYPGSSTIYVSSDTKSSPQFGSINLNINSKCFGIDSCDYESSAWATLALLKTKHDVDAFIPYLIALADANKNYLPTAFVYMITSYEDYGTKLIKEQQLGNYWEAELSAKNKYYDTGLALLALKRSSSEQVTKARDWLFFTQSSDGCWEDITTTAMALWGLTTRGPQVSPSSTSSDIQYCKDEGYFCITKTDCPENQQMSEYYCSGLSSVCCKQENLKTCSENLGEICGSNEICSGNVKKSSDTEYCCLSSCEIAQETGDECDNEGYICRDECSSNQEEVQYTCSSGVCCKTKTTTSGSGSKLWIWILIIAILLVLLIIAYIQRDKIKLWWFKQKTKFKKDKSPPPSPSPFPARPGFPPIVRRPMPMRSSPMPPKKDKAIDDTFRKLKDMSK